MVKKIVRKIKKNSKKIVDKNNKKVVKKKVVDLNLKKLVNSLNDKQKNYVNLSLSNPKNGEYLLSIFHLIPGKRLNILQAAAEVASE
ncbi:MAG: hypothetical protein PHP82_04270, partial [Candidatus ainarchaeum sp.]|nr:hypothetical protein [Candidatus ainarchaeum sp.]